jgi:hypothetical protein
MKKTNFALLLILIFGCTSEVKEKVNTYTSDSQTINLYPGYLAKSKGIIYWFPKMPNYQNETWIGENSVILNSCINDPWPYTEGDSYSFLIITE